MTRAIHRSASAQEVAATNLRSFRTFLLMREFAAREIGQRIAQARKEAGGLTQAELAEALNVSQRSLQDYEAGKTIPWKHFQLLARIFDRPVEWFIHGQAGAGASDEDELVRLRAELAAEIERLRLLNDALEAELKPAQPKQTRRGG